MKRLNSANNAPFLITIALARDQIQDHLLMDCDHFESQCVDQLLHVAVDSKLRIHAIEQSKGTGLSNNFLPSKILMQENMKRVLKQKVQELDRMS